MAGVPPLIEPSCAICGAPASPECPHEGDRLKLALDQAITRWSGMEVIREWVLNQARNAVIGTFHQLREARFQHHQNFLQTLPCYTLYFRWNGNPPIDPSHLHILHSQIQQANMQYQQMVDEDWRRSCLRYPEVLDYYLGLVEISLPDGQDTAVREPQFGAAVKERPRVKARKDSGERTSTKEHRKKERRRSRGRTPPPHAPMPGGYR